MSVHPLPARLRLANADPVQMFWFGGPLPEAHRICLMTWVRQGYCPQLWCYEPQDPIGGVDQRDANQVIPEHLANDWLALPDLHAKQTFANIFRYTLMFRVGSGWWADTDFVCLGRLPGIPVVFTTIDDIPTRPELLALYPSLPKVGANIQNSLFRIDRLDQDWLHSLALETWQVLNSRECPAFGVTGTVWFSKYLHRTYSVIPHRKLIGNNWHNRARIFEDPDWRPAEWAKVLHLYNFTKPQLDQAVPGSCWSVVLDDLAGKAILNT